MRVVAGLGDNFCLPRTMRGPVCLAVLLVAVEARAGRPLITDDAGVVGDQVFQIETWLRLDRDAALHQATAAYGPLDLLEIGLSAVHGVGLDDADYAVAGPTLQAKLLAFEPEAAGYPGLALAAGVSPPFGSGVVEPDGWTSYGYVAITEIPSSSEWLALHANVGAIGGAIGNPNPVAPLFGVAAIANVVFALSLFVEIVSGDHATEEIDGVAHGGLKYDVFTNFQLDATVGAGLWGESSEPPFATLGLRWATD